MAQSLAKVVVHVIFGTKERRPLITDQVREELHAYLVGIAKTVDSPTILVNSTIDHVHILLSLSRKYSIADVIEELKKGSSKWIKTKSPAFRDFYWQAGYGVFSVSESNITQVRDYIASQEAHHCKMTFQEEFREFLEKYKVAYDERYVWD